MACSIPWSGERPEQDRAGFRIRSRKRGAGLGGPRGRAASATGRLAAADARCPMTDFDYAAPAGLFTKTSRQMRGQTVKYRRFATAAEAIRCAVEELPAPFLPGITMEVEADTF